MWMCVFYKLIISISGIWQWTKGNAKNNPNRFCYICGKVAMLDQHSKFTQLVVKLLVKLFVKLCYLAYFGIRIGDQDKYFAPQRCCRACAESLRH